MSRHPYYIKLINSRKWVNLRLWKLSEAKYLCERCAAAGRTTPATEVHHITPVESGISDIQMKALCYNFDNLQALCHRCHKEAHKELQSYKKESIKERNKERTDHFVNVFLKKAHDP